MLSGITISQAYIIILQRKAVFFVSYDSKQADLALMMERDNRCL